MRNCRHRPAASLHEPYDQGHDSTQEKYGEQQDKQHPAGASERRHIARNLRLRISVNHTGYNHHVPGDLSAILEPDIA